MSIFVYGTDPFSTSPSSMVLLKELLSAGFKKSEIQYANTPEKIEDNSYVLCFGAQAVRELTGLEEPMRELRGTLCSSTTKNDVLVFPAYSPGYLFHNESEKSTFKADLELFFAVIRVDQGVPV